MTSGPMEGVVTKTTGLWNRVRLVSGEKVECRLKGKFKLSSKKVTNPIAVGDKVVVEENSGYKGTGNIISILPRENYIERKSVHKTEHSHLLAANIDQVAIMITIHHPRTSMGFIDRLLVSAEAFRIPSILILNKLDLFDPKDWALAGNLEKTYEPLNYSLKVISAKFGDRLDQLKSNLYQKVTLLAGHSGTGKSTLINRLIPGTTQSVSEVSSFANKGVHTTTFAEMFDLPDGGSLIDTPGIKELGLIDIGEQELSDYFPEMRSLIGQCKYNNCLHTHEPGCAIQQAVEDQTISISRFESYLSMLENEDSRR